MPDELKREETTTESFYKSLTWDLCYASDWWKALLPVRISSTSNTGEKNQ